MTFDISRKTFLPLESKSLVFCLYVCKSSLSEDRVETLDN